MIQVRKKMMTMKGEIKYKIEFIKGLNFKPPDTQTDY